MTATNHVVTGALIATYIHNPWVALPLAFVAHFALDALPHFNYPAKSHHSLRFFIWLAADSAIAASILMTLYALQPEGVYRLLAAAIVCASPDLMWLYYTIYKHGKGYRPWLVRLHGAVQTHTGVRYWPVELSWLVVTGAILVNNL